MSDPDAYIIQELQSGNRNEVFEILYDKYSARVFNFCLNFLGNKEDAMDCTQDIFIKVFKSINSFRHDSLFYTWLYRIMVNNCKDMNKKRTEYINRRSPALSHDVAADEKPATTVLSTKQAIEAFHDALKTLPARQKELLILRDVDGKSYDEISQLTGCRQGTVKSRLSRARNKMAELLKDYKNEL